MKLTDALDYANSFYIPELIFSGGYDSIESERQRGEDALKTLVDEWNANENPSFGFDLIRELADRNRGICDHIGEARLRNLSSPMLARSLSDADMCAAIGKLQGRGAATVMREVRGDANAYAVAWVRKPIKGKVLGIDIETTGRAPERGYIINVGWELMEMTSDAVPTDGEAVYCGLPEEPYRETGVPLTDIHHITWDMVAGKTPFREDKALQKRLLTLMKKYPIMAHNAAFEDSWFRLHLDGYAEARRAGKIIVIDSRHICRSLDGEVRTLPRESAPAALENWARRRGTLVEGEAERHLGLDDTDLMLKTVQAEMNQKSMFAK